MGREVRRKAHEVRRQEHAIRTSRGLCTGAVLACGLLVFWSPNGWSNGLPKEGESHQHPAAAPSQTMMQQQAPAKQQSQLATPKRWQFTLPPGDHDAGRQVFADFECFKCHEVRGEKFPLPEDEQGDVGSDLSGMGAMHPAEYFAELMIDPNASVAWRITQHKSEKKGYLGADGTSKMPNYNDTMTIQQLIDLVAYMKSLTAGGHQH